MIKMILCTDLMGAIGKNNDLLYNIKEDMKLFKSYTKGATIVMGYNTWTSLPLKPLPGRKNVILSASHCINLHDNVIVAREFNDILELAKTEDIIVIGGAQLYNKFIQEDLVEEVMLTMVQEINKDEPDTFVDIQTMQINLRKRELFKIIEDSKHVAHVYKFTKQEVTK